jgi:transposase
LQRTLVAEGHEPHRRRIQAILLLARGEATRTVAATVGVSVGSIHSWAKAWSAGGLRGLVGRSGVARNPVIDASAKRLLEERLSAAPGAYGHVATAWTLALLQAELAETGCVVVHGTVWSALKLLGWRYARPGYVKVSPIGCRSGRPE